MEFPYLKTENKHINDAYRLAVSTVFCNIVPYNNGKKEEIVLAAGLDYGAPWTRDASINTWNGCGLICPEITKRTLLGILDEDCVIGSYAGQSWDNIIWTVGAWHHYLYTGELEFLKTMHTATMKTLVLYEKNAFAPETGLFRGAACYGDGIAAYGDRYATSGESGILESPKYRSGKMCTLSTNCLFYEAYVLCDRAAAILKLPQCYEEKAKRLKESINRLLWNEERGMYDYYIDEDGREAVQETLGNAFAVLFGVADARQAARLTESQYSAPRGVPCVYPSYKRYTDFGENCFGRHSGTVWPFIQGFWADAAARAGRTDLFDREFALQTENAVGTNQFYEIYHPITGEPYGGLQERNGKIGEWKSMRFQTWSATAYLRNVYMDIFGLWFQENGIHFRPWGSSLAGTASLEGIRYRGCTLDIHLTGTGSNIRSFRINGAPSEPFVPADAQGKLCIEISMG